MSSASKSSEVTLEETAELARTYEALRKDAVEQRRVSSVGAGISVLRRQGLAAWMQLQRTKPRGPRSRTKRAGPPPAPARSELLGVLTDLVFHAFASRSSP